MDDPDEWDFDIHQQFVEAIFREGLKKCSPSTIVKNMAVKDNEDVTLERVKSHLQKFRANKSKSLAEFMISYNNAIERYREFLLAAGAEGDQKKMSSKVARTFFQSDINHISSVITESDKGLILSGEVAAFLTIASFASSSYATEANDNQACLSPLSQNLRTSDEGGGSLLPCDKKPPIEIDELALSNPPMFLIRCTEGNRPLSVQFPVLTDEEKRSPIGALLCYLMGNFISLNELVMKNREASSPEETCSIAHMPLNSSSMASKQSPQYEDSDSTREGVLKRHGTNQHIFTGEPNEREKPVTRDGYGIPYLPNSTDISQELDEESNLDVQRPLENIIHSLPASYNHQTVKGIHHQPLSIDDPNDREYPIVRDAYGIPFLPNSREINNVHSFSTSSATLSPRQSQRLAQPIDRNDTERPPRLLMNRDLTPDKQCKEQGSTTGIASFSALPQIGTEITSDPPTDHAEVIHGQINESFYVKNLGHTTSDSDNYCNTTNASDNSPPRYLPKTSPFPSKGSNPSMSEDRSISLCGQIDCASANNCDYPGCSEGRKRDAGEDLRKDLEKSQKKYRE